MADDRWQKARRESDDRLSQIGRAAAKLRHLHAMRVLAKRRFDGAPDTPVPVVRLGVRFKGEL